nr:hypothetical protein [Alicycliphilus denitrificans]
MGDRLDVDGPFGHAWLRPTERDVVCVAGGSGLGPMLSVARGVLAGGGTRRVHFFLGLRTQAELGAAHEAAALAPDRVTTTVVLSSPAAGRGRRASCMPRSNAPCPGLWISSTSTSPARRP